MIILVCNNTRMTKGKVLVFIIVTIYQTTAFEKSASAMSFQTHAGESGRMVDEACHQQLVLILDSEPYSRCIRPVSSVTNAPRTCTRYITVAR